jgi:predicted RND superfamily exporter protein
VDVATYIARDQMIFVPLVFLILAAMTAVLYRHPVGMLVPLTTVTLALVWTLGAFGLAGRALNPVTSLMTPVILVMSLEGTIQLSISTSSLECTAWPGPRLSNRPIAGCASRASTRP